MGRLAFIVVLIGLIFSFHSARASGFFDKYVTQEKQQWYLFSPEDVLETAFPDGEEKIEINQNYRLEINIPATRLSLYKGHKIIKQYPIAVGAVGYKTPVGKRYLNEVIWNPWWYPPTYSSWARNAKPEPPGPHNPLGPVKMSLGGDIRLHGTNKEWSVGHPASHGCIRMKNKDARELAWFFQKQFSTQTDESQLSVYAKNRGTSFPVKLSQQIPVDIIYDRVAVIDGEEIEIFPDVYGRQSDVRDQIVSELLDMGLQPWDFDPMKIEEFLQNKTGQKIQVLSLVTSGI